MAKAQATAGPPKTGQEILPLIEQLARLGRRSGEASLPDGLRPRHLIALRLLREQGPLPQHSLGATLSLDPSNVVGLLNELEDRGLVTRRRDPADRRRHIVELSPAGDAQLCAAYERLGSVEDELFAALTTAERATLQALLARAVDAFCAGSGPCTADDTPCAGPAAEAAPCLAADAPPAGQPEPT